MTEQEANAEALRRIRHAGETGAEVLDLGDLPLARLPPELGELGRLRVLALGDFKPVREEGRWGWKLDGRLPKAFEDLGPLRGLPALASLDLSRCLGVSDLGPLRGLTALASLNLSGTVVSDLGPLRGLTALAALDLSACRGVTDFTPVLPLLGQLEQLMLSGCRFRNLPPELCGELGENVIDKVRAHFADLGRGVADDAEVKLFLLGNGGVGKTQVRGRLCDANFRFNPNHDSTHGVQIDHFDLAVPGRDRPVRLNLWDFGGQDIYHGTHALFLHERAVFVLVWDPDLEAGTFVENDIPMRHRPLPYWLDYVRGLAGTDAPVVVVKNKCDAVTADRSPHPAMPADFPFCEHVPFSARTGRGLPTLREKLAEAVEYLYRDRPFHSIGVGRVRVRDRLRAMLEADQECPEAERRHRTLTRAEFDALCAEGDGDVSDPAALLDFLHQTGVVYHREGQFGDRIILDQSWALDGIYAVFHRQRTLRQLRQTGGRFTLGTLAYLAWSDKPVADQRALLGMMESCGICFRARRLPDEDGEEVHEYLAPDLRPEWPEVERALADRIPPAPPDAKAVARCRFLHEGLLRSFLSRIGTGGGDHAEYGRYGCYFYDARTRGKVVVRSELAEAADSGAGEVSVEAWGGDAESLAERVLETFLRLPFGQPPEVTRSWPDRGTGRPEAPAEADVPFVIAAEPRPDNREVFISYAWGVTDEEVTALCAALRSWGRVVLRDRDEVSYGDSIRDFMKRAGTAARVVLVVGEKYLRSEYCMAELFEVYVQAKMEKAEFLARVIPIVLPGTQIATPEQRRRHSKFWEERHRALDSFKPSELAGEDHANVPAFLLWWAYLPRLLHHIADTLHPVGFEEASADDYAYLRRRLGWAPPLVGEGREGTK